LHTLCVMDITWPSILRVINKLEVKLGNRITALEERVHATISCNGIAYEQPPREAAAVGGSPREQSPKSMPERRGLTAQMASMNEALFEVRVTVGHLQQQLVSEHTRLEDSDVHNEAMSQSLEDLVSAIHREAGVREKQVSKMELRLCDACKQHQDLYQRMEELSKRFECGPRLQPQVGQPDLSGMKQVDADCGACSLGDRVAKFSQQVVVHLDEMRGKHKTSKDDAAQQHGGKVGDCREPTDALTVKTSALSQLTKRLSDETSVVNLLSAVPATSVDTIVNISDKAHVFNDADSSRSTLDPREKATSLSDGLSSVSSDRAADPHVHLRGKVRRLVRKFGGNPGTGILMEEESTEASDESVRNVRMTVSGGDETNAMLLYSRGATGAYTPTSRVSQQLQQQWQQQQQKPIMNQGQVGPQLSRQAGVDAVLCERSSPPLDHRLLLGVPTDGAAPSETGIAAVRAGEQHTGQDCGQINGPVGSAHSPVVTPRSIVGSARRPRSHSNGPARGWALGLNGHPCMSADQNSFRATMSFERSVAT